MDATGAGLKPIKKRERRGGRSILRLHDLLSFAPWGAIMAPHEAIIHQLTQQGQQAQLPTYATHFCTPGRSQARIMTQLLD